MNTVRPKQLARFAGVLYLAIFALAPFAFVFSKESLVVAGDSEATAAKVMDSETLFRFGMAAEVIVVIIEIALAGVLYVLFRTVSQTVSLTAAFARLGEAIVQAVNLLTAFLALTVLGGAGYLSVADEDQRHALAMLFLEANSFVVLIWGLLFGLHLALLGWLVAGSGFIPRIIGTLLVVASVGYLAEGFGNIVAPGSSDVLSILVIILAVPGELAFAAWLAVRGVDEKAWHSRARALA